MLSEVVFGFFAVFAVHLDLTTGRVPNFWTALFFLAGTAFIKDPAAYAAALLAIVFGFFVWKFRAWQAGDAKFFGTLVFWGFAFGMPVFFAVPLFLFTAGLCGIASWFKRGTEKYLRLPGA
ncbi:MAG TPA: hypothetical protein VI874_01970, partial [Candidatus Norongarragalinales archaeon]|nr:hypothetical protein [Candidatus Norongarragalinales archaeon]